MKAENRSPRDPLEGRESRALRPKEGNMAEPLSSLPVSTRLRRIAELARDDSKVFNSIAHLIDEDLLRSSFDRLRAKAAPGIDGQSKASYAKNLDANLRDLHQRLRAGRYRATPSRQMWIPKEDGSQRRLSIPVLEDKIVQKAASQVTPRCGWCWSSTARR